MATVYIETSIVSYLRQRPSSKVVMAARQLLTHQWWDDERGNYELERRSLCLMKRRRAIRCLPRNGCNPLTEFRCCRVILGLALSPTKSWPERFFRPRHPLMRCISPWLPITGYNTYWLGIASTLPTRRFCLGFTMH